MQDGKHKRLLDAGLRYNRLREEVGLPERLGMGLHELMPGAGASLRARVDALLLEDLSYGRSTDALDAELLQFSDDSTVTPARLFGQADDDFSDRLRRSFTPHRLGRLLAVSYLTLPPLVRSGADDGSWSSVEPAKRNSSGENQFDMTSAFPSEKSRVTTFANPCGSSDSLRPKEGRKRLRVLNARVAMTC